MTAPAPPFAPRHTVPSNRPAPDRPAETPRKQAESSSAKDRFASKLEREGPGERSERKSSGTLAEAGHSSGRFVQERGHDGGSDGFEGFTQSSVSMQALVAGTAKTSATEPLLRIDPSMLQRMAAQIAENWPSAATQSVSIQFPEGMIAETALVRREPDGGFAIRIMGLNPALNARQNARIQLELVNALALRRLKVGSLEFEKSASDHRALPSAISRAV